MFAYPSTLFLRGGTPKQSSSDISRIRDVPLTPTTTMLDLRTGCTASRRRDYSGSIRENTVFMDPDRPLAARVAWQKK
ncbi:hypothetical protein [Nitrosomonas sp. GH22]|uniref:hypothetical protein n=1 Tax=Nitrosomonas sp. GH22 TaxID=153947 RepID=UPI0013706CF9|nr:hypothetical protein [Nitrosomonas sp. GH22]